MDSPTQIPSTGGIKDKLFEFSETIFGLGTCEHGGLLFGRFKSQESSPTSTRVHETQEYITSQVFTHDHWTQPGQSTDSNSSSQDETNKVNFKIKPLHKQ